MEAGLLYIWLEKTLSKIQSLKDDEITSRTMIILKELQLLIKPVIFSNVDDEDTRFLAFFLNSYIDAVFMDLLGDIPDDVDGVLQSIRKDFFVDISRALKNMLINIHGNDKLKSMQELVKIYSDAVNQINYTDIKLGRA